MKKNIYWSVCIQNTVAMICWTTLAVIFDKWWIALFGVLFLSSIKTKDGTRIICDKCGKRGPVGDDVNKAREAAEKEGWLSYRVKVDEGEYKHVDYCPKCQRFANPFKF